MDGIIAYYADKRRWAQPRIAQGLSLTGAWQGNHVSRGRPVHLSGTKAATSNQLLKIKS
jgi:hypothetical protein